MATTEPVIIPIEGDPSDFVKDASKVNSELDKMTKATKAATDASAKGAKAASMSWTDFRSAYSTVLDVVRVGQQVWQATGQEFVNYAEQVKNMSRNIGASAEETSRLIQVADDVRISYDTLNVAMKSAQKEGITMSTEGLAKLSDQYLQLQPGVERTQFLLSTFGKAGLEMGKLMEQGGNKIRAAAADVDEMLIVTEEGIKASDDYQKAVDDLSDSFDALKIGIGNELLPVMNKYLDTTNSTISVYKSFIDEVVKGDKSFAQWTKDVKDSGTTFDMWGFHVKEGEEAEQQLNQELDKGTGLFEENGKAATKNTAAIKAADEALKAYKDAVEAASQANQDALGFTLDYAQGQREYAEAHKQAVDALELATDDVGIEKAEKALQALEVQWHESTNKMIYDMVQTKLSVDGLSDAEYKAAQDLAVQMGLITQAEADQAKAMMDTANAIFEGIQAQEDVKKEANKTAEEIAKLEADKQAASGETTDTQIQGAQEAATATTTASAATTQTVITDTQTQANAMAAVTNATLGEVNAQTQLQNSVRQTTQDYLALAAAAATVPASPTTTTASTSLTPDVVPNSSGGPDDRDNGGYGVAGTTYMIGTGAQPELFTPATNGYFTPANKQGGSKNITVNITNPKAEASEDSIRKTLKKLSYIGVVS